MTIEQLFQRACHALYICPSCGATIFGRDIRMSRMGFALTAPDTLPTFTCMVCDAGILEPIENQ